MYSEGVMRLAEAPDSEGRNEGHKRSPCVKPSHSKTAKSSYTLENWSASFHIEFRESKYM